MRGVIFQSLTDALRSLFPSSISVASLPIVDPIPKGFPEEEICIEGVNDLRKREFRAGRMCAHRALSALGADSGPIIASENRGPIWPDGIIGSISHTRKHCIAAVAETKVVSSIGLDMELYQRMKPHLWRLVLTGGEYDALSALKDEQEKVLLAALIFSAKEAFYKYQYPLTQVWLGFQDAEVVISPETSTFSLKVLNDVEPFGASGTIIQGRYACYADYVLSGLFSSSNKKAPKS